MPIVGPGVEHDGELRHMPIDVVMRKDDPLSSRRNCHSLNSNTASTCPPFLGRPTVPWDKTLGPVRMLA